MYIFNCFSRQIYSYGFHISQFNNLKVIYGLYSQCFTQTLSKTTFFMGMEGVYVRTLNSHIWDFQSKHLLSTEPFRVMHFVSMS